MKKQTLKNFPIANKKVLMRVDFNTPLNEDFSISDDTRIKKTVPSIKYLLENNCSIILMSHLGRPKGKKVENFSLLKIKDRLSQLLKKDILFAKDCVDENAKTLAKNLESKQILLLENLRFHEAEKNPEKDKTFAKKLASFAEIYINEAFSVCHRNHSSICPITKLFPKKAIAGFLLEKEIFYFDSLKNPKRPFYAILGGSKIYTKINIILKLLEKTDAIFIGGGMAFSFFKAKEQQIGKSLFEKDQLENIKKIIFSKKINLPLDIKIADDFNNQANTKIISSLEDIPPNYMGLDIGPKTVHLWQQKLKDAKTIFFNGPLGAFEMENFSFGTNEMIKILANLSCTKIAGGGDSIAAINKLNLQNKFTHISTGGGASLKYIEDGTLIGIEALSNQEN